jgi:hypothetical protein
MARGAKGGVAAELMSRPAITVEPVVTDELGARRMSPMVVAA